MLTIDGGGYCAQGRRPEDHLGMRNDCGLGGDSKGEREWLDYGSTKEKASRIC